MDFCKGGKCGLFGEGGLIMFDVNTAKATYSTPDLLAVIFLGVIGGILGSLYNFFVNRVLRCYSFINEYASRPFLMLIFFQILHKNAVLLIIIVNVLQERSFFQNSSCHGHFPIDLLLLIRPTLAFKVHSLPPWHG